MSSLDRSRASHKGHRLADAEPGLPRMTVLMPRHGEVAVCLPFTKYVHPNGTGSAPNTQPAMFVSRVCRRPGAPRKRSLVRGAVTIAVTGRWPAWRQPRCSIQAVTEAGSRRPESRRNHRADSGVPFRLSRDRRRSRGCKLLGEKGVHHGSSSGDGGHDDVLVWSGAAPFNATPTGVMASGLPAGTIMDMVPLENIPTFGMCTTPSNPEVASATAAASECSLPCRASQPRWLRGFGASL